MKLKYNLLPIITILLTTGCSNNSSDSFVNYGGYDKFGQSSILMGDINNYNYKVDLPSVGDSKILVVPVQLEGEQEWTEEMLNAIDIAFFGEAEETNYWETVSSFYKKSSYGKVNISGEVSPVLKSNITKAEFIADYDYYYEDKIIEQFENDSIFDDFRIPYDTDSDGLIESVAFIYSNRANDYEFWAYVTWKEKLPSKLDINNPIVNTYMWASYPSFIGSADKIDAHTYIHETGHLFGLDDLYSYDDDRWDCAGPYEMQSHNVGDQGAFMKYSLGWIEPYYVNGSKDVTTIEIRPSSLYGDAIIINDNWNGHAMDEYLMIDFYTPTGNNELDSKTRYSNGIQMYSSNGIRIAHIDSRMVSNKTYIDELPSNKDTKAYVAHSNSASWSYAPDVSKRDDYKLNLLCDYGERNTYDKKLSVLRTGAIWGEGKTFIPSSKYFIESETNGPALFNDGTEVGYKITVDEIKEDGSSATVTITKI